MPRTRFFSGFCLFLVVLAASGAANAGANPPRLVLQITVDGLRADLLTSNLDRMGDDGFRRLLDHGIHYTNAHYTHANTETIVGHATLATGAQPASHGMTGNAWYDATTGQLSYNIEDADHPILPSRTTVIEGVQADPAQRLSRTAGRSPKTLLMPTIADVIMKNSTGRAKVFGISGKDRSAVAMAGQAGKAFWFSTNSGDFVTSTYYYDSYPDWVQKWNEGQRAESYAGSRWQLLHDSESYRHGRLDDRSFEADLKGFGRTFPHEYGQIDGGLLPTQLVASPEGDRLLADFAQTLIVNEKIGRDEDTDYLSISFSGIDAINHFFGPASLETEDGMLQFDRTLAALLDFVDKEIGLEHTLIVLSADHGAAEMPEYMTTFGLDADRLYPEEIVQRTNAIASERWDLEEVVRFFFRPYLYLDRLKIEAAGLNVDAVSTGLADALSTTRGIQLAVPPSQLQSAPDSQLIRQIRNNYHPQRSGDIYIVQSPYWFNSEKGPVVAMHGSPWNYDTHVPIVFSGPSLSGTTVSRSVEPADVAPTIAALLGLHSPAGATGEVLTEVLEGS